MDWGRAKNIILAVLVVTNIFLIAVYGLRYGHAKANNSELRSYTIDKLSENRIELECEIPEKPGKIPALSVRYEKYDSNTVERAIEEIQAADTESSSGKPESKEAYEAAAAGFLDDCGLLPSGGVTAEFTEEEGIAVVHFENSYDGIPLEECYMDVIFTDGIITDFRQQWVEPVEEGAAKLSITEPVTALLSFIDIVNEERRNGAESPDDEAENALPVDQTVSVESICLVYYVDKESVGANVLYDTAFPAWRIEYNGGRIRYISAFEQ